MLRSGSDTTRGDTQGRSGASHQDLVHAAPAGLQPCVVL